MKKQNLYNSIMKDVSKIVKKHLDEAFDFNKIDNANKKYTSFTDNLNNVAFEYQFPKIVLTDIISLSKEIYIISNFMPQLYINYIDNNGVYISHYDMYNETSKNAYRGDKFEDLADMDNNFVLYMDNNIKELYISEIKRLFKLYKDKKIKSPAINITMNIDPNNFGDNYNYSKKLIFDFFDTPKYKKYIDLDSFFIFDIIPKNPLENYTMIIDFLTDLLNYCKLHKKEFKNFIENRKPDPYIKF
jgi:hypothetical protein